MIVKRLKHKIFDNNLSNLYSQIFVSNYNSMSTKYEEAVNCINSLQTNASYIKNVQSNSIFPETTNSSKVEIGKYLLRAGVSLEQLDKLPVIHVAGTKGKGSTCAFCESILRHHGYKTGFYSSPHLVSVKERIKLNGKSINEDYFADNVIEIYNKLFKEKEYPNDMPLYFRFLTIVAFKIFVDEKVDVAVIEVGIGGENDCTNILRTTQVVGITSLGMDHEDMLGHSITEIAWQKAGIMKPNSMVFTVDQSDSAMTILKQRAIEKNCYLQKVPKYDEYLWNNDDSILSIIGCFQKINASLSIQLAHSWMAKYGNNISLPKNNLELPELTKRGLAECKWPGRYQILKLSNLNIFLDGAHTSESLKICAEWFRNNSHTTNKILIFNMIGHRDSKKHLRILKTVDFCQVMFVPNIGSVDTKTKDQTDFKNTDIKQQNRCEAHKNIWLEINEKHSNEYEQQYVMVFPSIQDAINSLPKEKHFDILITGSLYLIGAALSLLDPKLKTF